MVTSGVGGPTYRLGVFLDTLLKPVVQQYCHKELVKDSADFLVELKDMEENVRKKRMRLIGTLDVDALYPSIRLDLALRALQDALSTVTSFSVEEVQMIIQMAQFCIVNSVVHYRGKWFKSLLGIPTGGPESGSIANLVVYFVLEKVLLVDPRIAPLNDMVSRKRFLDDLFFGWCGTERQFAVFKGLLNEVGRNHGITFKGDVGKSVDFLDISVDLHLNGKLTTKMFVKPTDATRYLNRRSDHSPHTFASIPFSQFRRAVVLCSNPNEKIRCIDYITEKLRNSGFKNNEIENAKQKAMALNREEILSRQKMKSTSSDTDKQLTFLINRNGFMCKEIKKVLRQCTPDIERLLGGKTRIIVAERKNSSIASTVFAKSSFSKLDVLPRDTQKCNGPGCMSCDVMDMKDSVTLWKNNPAYRRTVKLDFRCNCTTECVTYLYICKLCKQNDNFYVGQTANNCQRRANGHRGNFNPNTFRKSALSFHIYKDHPQYIDRKLNNFSLGVIRSSNATDLDRLEDYYVDHLHAKLSLNRYKVTSS